MKPPEMNGWARIVEKAGISGICVVLLWALLVRVPDAIDKQGDKIVGVVRSMNEENQKLLRILMDENRVGRDIAVQKVIEEVKRKQ